MYKYKARYQGALEEAAKRLGPKRSKIKINALAMQDLSTHVVDKDRPSRRPPTQEVIAAIMTQERQARRL
eukprot:6199988-Pleurochrysis_carterae.AAC.8